MRTGTVGRMQSWLRAISVTPTHTVNHWQAPAAPGQTSRAGVLIDPRENLLRVALAVGSVSVEPIEQLPGLDQSVLAMQLALSTLLSGAPISECLRAADVVLRQEEGAGAEIAALDIDVDGAGVICHCGSAPIWAVYRDEIVRLEANIAPSSLGSGETVVSLIELKTGWQSLVIATDAAKLDAHKIANLDSHMQEFSQRNDQEGDLAVLHLLAASR